MTPIFYKLCLRLGVPPYPWLHPNPIKIYEYYQVTKKARLTEDAVALDLGCGRGHWTYDIARRSKEVVGVDVSEKMLRTARRIGRNSRLKDRVRFIHSTLEDANLPQDQFDRIFSFCVLEHIPNLPDVLKELYRITKPGGEMHVSVDSLGTIDDEELLAKHKADHKVHQYFTADSIKQKVEAAGFEVQEVRPILTGETARAEFSRRITKGYKPQFLHHIKAYKSFVEEDKTPGEKGIMLVVRASKPD